MFCIIFGKRGKRLSGRGTVYQPPIWPAAHPLSSESATPAKSLKRKTKTTPPPPGFIVTPFPHARAPWLKIQRSGPRGCKQSETRKLGQKMTLEEEHHFWAILGDLHCHLKPGLCLGSCWGMLTPYSWCSFHVDSLLLRQHSWPFHTLLLIPPRRG